jgi:hypothetical protein
MPYPSCTSLIDVDSFLWCHVGPCLLGLDADRAGSQETIDQRMAAVGRCSGAHVRDLDGSTSSDEVNDLTHCIVPRRSGGKAMIHVEDKTIGHNVAAPAAVLRLRDARDGSID